MYRAGIVFGEFGVAGDFTISTGVVGLGLGVFVELPRVILVTTLVFFSIRISIGKNPEYGLL